MKLERTGVVYDSVTGVIAAGVACDDCSVFGKEINYLSFALVAPLGADDGVCLQLITPSLRATGSQNAIFM